MKKILLTVCLALASVLTFAQKPGIGIKGGVNFATMINSAEGTNTMQSGVLTNFNAGVFADLKLGGIWLQPALNFTGKGGKDNSDFNGTYKLYYLQLPINFVCHIPVIAGNIYFGAGPYIARGITGKLTDYTENYPNITLPMPLGSSGTATTNKNIAFGNGSNDDIRSTQFGADAVAGFKFKNGFLINLNYDLGLSNDIPKGRDYSNKYQSRVFGISVGYVFL